MDFPSLFSFLPKEIRKEEIYNKHLDDLSRLIVRKELLRLPYEEKDFTPEIGDQIIMYGIEMTTVFWVFLDEDDVCWISAKYGSLDVFEMAYERNYPVNPKARSAIGQYGRLAFLKLLVKNKDMPLLTITDAAAQYGQLSLIRFLWKWENGKYIDHHCANIAAEYCHISILEYAKANGLPFNTNLPLFAAKSGRLEILKYCTTNIQDCWNRSICDNAAESGNIEVLEYCLNKGSPMGTDICIDAINSGNIKMLQYCRERGASWNSLTFEQAARSQRMEMVRYCHENQCDFSDTVFYEAIKRNNIEMLSYLLENGYTWEEDLCVWICPRKQRDIFQYIRSHGCKCICHQFYV